MSTPAKGVMRPLALDAGELLRIVDGTGVLVRVKTGVLWLTEQDRTDDIVLSGGEVHRIGSGGITLVEASRTSRIVLEFPAEGPGPLEVGVGLPDASPLAPPLSRTLRGIAWLRGLWNGLPGARVLEPDESMPPETSASAPHDPRPFLPEAMRERVLRSLPYPYY